MSPPSRGELRAPGDVGAARARDRRAQRARRRPARSAASRCGPKLRRPARRSRVRIFPRASQATSTSPRGPTATDTLRTRPVASRSGGAERAAGAAQRDLDAVVRRPAVLEPRQREVAARVAGEARRRDPRVAHDAPRLPECAARAPERDPQLRARVAVGADRPHERDGGARAAVEHDVAGPAARRGAGRAEGTGRRARGDGLAATRTGADPVLQTPTNQPSAAGDEGDRHVVDEGVRPRDVARRGPGRRGRRGGGQGEQDEPGRRTTRRIAPDNGPRTAWKLLRTGGRAEAAVRRARRAAARRGPAPPPARRPTTAGARAAPG